ncbi:hypothetical protein CBR_g23882 [Chara braunii]|uniref:Formyl transferase C-terminal domain-containing protein n=1 Tax=Chara braunii TaxID=69332 RepID=A0A388L5G1_CHABU|nr:hypothetical protein CBR_g23882 [Chara braunii]|eukprot:GBG77433.1 hypothetical protein CBR_g23882 [Chara braunii]
MNTHVAVRLTPVVPPASGESLCGLQTKLTNRLQRVAAASMPTAFPVVRQLPVDSVHTGRALMQKVRLRNTGTKLVPFNITLARATAEQVKTERPVAVNEEAGMARQQQVQLRFLLVCDAFNSMSQRTKLEIESLGHEAVLGVWETRAATLAMIKQVRPDVILCPYLTKFIPPSVYQNRDVPCIIVHPGIEGDRGMSSIDWALLDGAKEWGVTLLQADREMDAGPIWATRTFLIERDHPTKSSLYRIECIDAAMECIHEFVAKLVSGVQPRPLDYSDTNVKGRLRPKMLPKDRTINWNFSAEEIARIVRGCDSQPGAMATVEHKCVYLFGAHVEKVPDRNLQALIYDHQPGDVIGCRDNAILIRCGHQTAIWISHIRISTSLIKLPAMMALFTTAELPVGLLHIAAPDVLLPFGHWPTYTFQEIFLWRQARIAYLWFDFYNGAMNTEQCHRLARIVTALNQDESIDVIVFMGGRDFFSNGIHLNTIEAAEDPSAESWRNINAMDDFVKCILTSPKLTVSALVGNAGAGGVMAALAADFTWTHASAVLHPTYKSMDLFGSEYWTYSLPKRAGSEVAHQLTSSIDPVSAGQAHSLGLIDEILCKNRHSFLENVVRRAEELARDPASLQLMEEKKGTSCPEFVATLESCRQYELEKMRVCFASEGYNAKRHAFVTKSRLPACRLGEPGDQITSPGLSLIAEESEATSGKVTNGSLRVLTASGASGGGGAPTGGR